MSDDDENFFDEWQFSIPSDIREYLAQHLEFNERNLLDLEAVLTTSPSSTFLRVNTCAVSVDDCRRQLQIIVDQVSCLLVFIFVISTQMVAMQG